MKLFNRKPKEKPIVVRIKTAGCDLYPHGTLHEVLPVKDGIYPTLNGRDRIDADWCEKHNEDFIDPECTGQDDQGFYHAKFWETAIPVKIKDGNYDDCININPFRRLGYNQDNSKTGYFTDDEYTAFEAYIHANNLKFEFKQKA